MPPPLKVDQISISPAVGETLLIGKATGGNLLFSDQSILSGITLKSLSGLNLTNLITVGVGSGSNYTTIQAAINAAPTTSTATNPTLICIYSGTYNEILTVDKNGLVFVGIGRVVINAPSDSDTILIEEGVSTVPLFCHFENIIFANSYDARSCFKILGVDGTTLGQDIITLSNCYFLATGLGTYCLNASILNSLRLLNCDCSGSIVSTSIFISQCAMLEVIGLLSGTDIALSYNNTSDIPSIITSTYSLLDSRFNNLTCVLIGEGLLYMEKLVTNNVIFDGNRAYTLIDCYGVLLQPNGTVTVNSKGSSYTLNNGTPTATVDIDNIQGSVSFTAETTKIVSFEVPTSNTDYMVLTSHPFVGEKEGVVKTVNGFTVEFSSNQTGTVDYLVRR
jgi:hypothetical protein